MVPPWFAGEAHGGGRRLGVLWASREGEGEEGKQREREVARAGGRVKGSRRSSARNYQNTPPFLLFWVKLTTFN